MVRLMHLQLTRTWYMMHMGKGSEAQRSCAGQAPHCPSGAEESENRAVAQFDAYLQRLTISHGGPVG